jgi:4-aminobutyrate aminotransferase
VAVKQDSAVAAALASRQRYVARGVSTPRLAVARAEGAWIEDLDGRRFLDFAGGIACQNLGHGNAAVVTAIHEQVDAFMHQCFMVGSYEPYVETCRRLAELSPCGGGEQRSLLLNSGAEAVENAVKIARAATGRDGVIVFDQAFHGRTLLTLAMTANVKYKHGFGPFPSEVYRAPAPYPYRGVSTAEAIAGLRSLFATEIAPDEIACVVLEPVQGEGGFIPVGAEFVRALREICGEHGILYVDDEVQSGVGRTGTIWAIEQYDVEPDLLVAGKSLGGGLPLASVTGPAAIMDAPAPGGLGGTFGGNPVACAAACVVLDAVASGEFKEQARTLGDTLTEALDALAARRPEIGEHRGLGAMRALELELQSPALAGAVTAAAFERGLLLLSCGTYGNVLRLLPPLTIATDELERGLGLLEEALVDASR